jgi:hypothetical protein
MKKRGLRLERKISYTQRERQSSNSLIYIKGQAIILSGEKMGEATEKDSGKEQVITVTVKVVDGDEGVFHFNADQLVAKGKEQVLHHFHIEPAPGVIYHFAFEVGKILDDNKTWRQQGVKSGAVLLFGTEQQVGLSVSGLLCSR